MGRLAGGDFGSSGAVLSADGRYRYLLWRSWDPAAPPLLFVMCNPSTADATDDDPTIRRCMGFARRERAGGIVVVNRVPYRATDPKALWEAAAELDVWHVHRNTTAWALARAVASRQIMAWGASRFLDGAAFPAGATTGYCLGKTKSGAPRHPLRLRADTPLVPYP
jgi:hypothetical protein